VRERSTSAPNVVAPEPPPPDADVLNDREEQVKKALSTGQTTVDILGLRAKFPQ
jgi:hypothetical protein